jgi:hypothetical protein
MVGHSCWRLHSPWLLLQQKLDDSWWWGCGVVEALMSTWEVQFCKSPCITSPGCEVVRGIAEGCHWWHTRPTNLINTSQATKYLVLGDCKSASPGEEQGQLLDRTVGVNQRKNTCLHFYLFAGGEVWRCPSEYLLHHVLLNFRSDRGTTSSI